MFLEIMKTYRLVGQINWIMGQVGWKYKYTVAQPNEHIRDGVVLKPMVNDFKTGL